MAALERRESGVQFAISVVIILVINVTFLIPLFLFCFYTLLQVIPTFAVVADSDHPIYAQIPLSDRFFNDPPIDAPDLQVRRRRARSSGLGVRSMLRQLLHTRSRFKLLGLLHGLRIFALVSAVELTIAIFANIALSPFFALLPQIVLPLALVQLYTLWAHMVLTQPSDCSWLSRLVPFSTCLQKTGPALVLLLGTKAVFRMALRMLLGEANIFDWITGDPDGWHPAKSFMVLALIQIIGVIPAHLVLTRIQVSLLRETDSVLVPIDTALTKSDRDENDNVGRLGATTHGMVAIRKAWITFELFSWGRLAALYVRISLVALLGGALVLFMDTWVYLFVAISSWRF